mgnify:CR=1 FL=1
MEVEVAQRVSTAWHTTAWLSTAWHGRATQDGARRVQEVTAVWRLVRWTVRHWSWHGRCACLRTRLSIAYCAQFGSTSTHLPRVPHPLDLLCCFPPRVVTGRSVPGSVGATCSSQQHATSSKSALLRTWHVRLRRAGSGGSSRACRAHHRPGRRAAAAAPGGRSSRATMQQQEAEEMSHVAAAAAAASVLLLLPVAGSAGARRQARRRGGGGGAPAVAAARLLCTVGRGRTSCLSTATHACQVRMVMACLQHAWCRSKPRGGM